MKRIWMMLVVLMLCGCTVAPVDLEQRLKGDIDSLLSSKAMCLADNHKTLYSYYTEPRIGRKSSTATSSVFVLDNYEFVMNLDVSSVMNSKYYPDLVVKRKKTGDELIYLEGQYSDCAGHTHDYVLSVFLLNNGKYYVDLQTHSVNFYSTLDLAMVDDVVLQMLKISRTVVVDELAIISYYSSKPADEYEREQVIHFQQQVSENGRLDELIGEVDSSQFEQQEPDYEDQIQDMPENWVDELDPTE